MTGATGFIDEAIVRELLTARHQVLVPASDRNDFHRDARFGQTRYRQISVRVGYLYLTL